MRKLLSVLSRYAFLAGAFLKINIQSGLEYPVYLISWLISNPLQFLFGLISLKVIIDSFQPLAGWTFGQVVFLYGLGIISHGLSVVLFIQTWGMDYFVTQGEFDRMLVRPMNVFFQFCFSEFNFIGFTDLIPGFVIFLYGCGSSGFEASAPNILKLLLVIAGATALRGGIYTISGALSFWTKRSGQLVSVHLRLFDFATQYPMSIAPKAVQGLFTFLLPLGFISFYPSSEFFGLDTAFILPGSFSVWTFIIGIAFYALSAKLFNTGLKRYESAGS